MPNLNLTAVGIRAWMSNYIMLFYVGVITSLFSKHDTAQAYLC